MRLFERSHRGQVRRAAARAEELTGRFYCIRGHEWLRFPYQIATLADEPGPDRAVFADVVRSVRHPGSAKEDENQVARRLYRIRLRDDRLLAAVDGRLDVRLFPLLLYVLCHELVHVVRFESGLAPYEAEDSAARAREELRVHSVTRKVLQPAKGPSLERVMECYFDSPGREVARPEFLG